jgi:hypothetical protein
MAKIPTAAAALDPEFLMKRWWIMDPVPWPWFHDRVDPRLRDRLAVVQLDYAKAMLSAQIKAQQDTLAILEQVKM